MMTIDSVAAIKKSKSKGQFKTMVLLRNNRGGSRAAATSKMECFVKIVNGFQPLTIITKRSILDVAAALDPPVNNLCNTKKRQLH